MAEAGKAFRTITRAFLARKLSDGTYRPLALPMAPQNASLGPGVSLEKLKEKGLQGAEQTVFTYDQGREATITLEFAAASVELESVITGRVFSADTNYTSYVYYNVKATATTLSARPSTEYTYHVDEQTAVGALANGTLAYYINSAGIALPLEIIDYSGTPSGDQIAIGASMALKLSTALVDANAEIYIKTVAEFPSAVRMTATPLTELSITLWGIRFDGAATRIINAQNCSPNLNAELSAEPQRSIEFEILSDSTAASDLGYDIIDVPYAIRS